MVKEGKKHELMPVDIWKDTVDAQRFLSLNTRESIEEIFTYATGDNPKILNHVDTPLLSILAENDEFKERPISKISEWFEINMNSRKSQTKIIKKSLHSFIGHEDEANKMIKNWVKSL